MSPNKPAIDDSLLAIHLKILVIGLDDAGKTTFVKRMQTGKFSHPSRTMGMNFDRVQIGNLILEIVDLGGQKAFISTIWPGFLKGFYELILYVIDSSDKLRLSITEKEFTKLIRADSLKETPIMVLANKQDLQQAMSSAEIALKLRLADASRGRTFQIIPTSMLTGKGFDDVISWIQEFGKIKQMKMQYENDCV